jgi:hypothetical protein
MTSRFQGAIALVLIFMAGASRSDASGHGPVFAAATPVNGRGGWTLDQAFTVRAGDDGEHSEMLKTMLSYGITEEVQLSVSVPLAMHDGNLSQARMMSLMSSDKELEGLVGYRFHKKPVGIGGRFESTLYVGGTLPFEVRRGDVQAGTPRPAAGASVEVAASTGYASRSHYVWVGGGVQRFFERKNERLGSSRLATVVYGYRPPFLRTEAGKPDLRFFGEATFEDRTAATVAGLNIDSARTVFAGPTTLFLYKAFGIEGGVLFPVYQSIGRTRVKERMRVAVNVSYFFWPKGHQ